jgi:hypothetical protein
MATEPSPGTSRLARDDELEALRHRVAELEQQLVERSARANSAVADAQDRSYWLDRWGIDLNRLMRRRGAAEARAAIRAARTVYRLLYKLRAQSGGLGRTVRAKLEEERSRG